MTETIQRLNAVVNGYVWGWPMIVLLMGTGLLLTILTGFVQVRRLGFALTEVLGKLTKHGGGTGSVRPFQAVATALASTVGVGNIAGVATAIAIGGPGSVFWLWLSGLFGMATKFAEIVVALHYREPDDSGTMRGGAMYVLKKGLGLPWLGAVFALLTSVAAFGIGNMVQANSVADALRATFGISTSATGIGLVVLTAIVILGGIKSIARVTEWLVPFMAILYLGGGLIVLVLYAGELPHALQSHLRRRVLGIGRRGRIRRQHDHDGDALRDRAGPVLERSRAGQRADGARRGRHGPSGAPGDVRHLRGVRRHHPDLLDHRAGDHGDRRCGTAA